MYIFCFGMKECIIDVNVNFIYSRLFLIFFVIKNGILNMLYLMFVFFDMICLMKMKFLWKYFYNYLDVDWVRGLLCIIVVMVFINN